MAVPFAPVEVVERTRRGDPVDAESVEDFVRRWIDGTSDDALMSAWCMLACTRGIGDGHADALMRALVASGDRLELARFGPTGDVVTTGGVGDSVPIAAAPLASALGVRVAQMASRGLGHAGGTADKLEAIPGMAIDLSLEEWVRRLRDGGIAVAAHHGRLAPAELRLAGLRDATGTVPAAGVVAASVMARAVASGAESLHVHVLHGAGAFVTDREAGLSTAALMERMAAPQAGTVTRIDGRGVGEVVRWLGAGRLHPDQSIDPAVGVELLVRPGDAVEAGQPMAVIHARDGWAAEEARRMAEAWFRVGEGDGDA